MWLTLLTTILPGLLDKLIPDPKAADEAKLKMLQMIQTGELAQLTADTDLAKGQISVNQVEATSSSIFVAGWRPFIGWMAGFTIGFKYIFGPLLTMFAQLVGHPIELPVLDASELWPVLIGMLGLGGMRTVEKVKGVA